MNSQFIRPGLSLLRLDHQSLNTSSQATELQAPADKQQSAKYRFVSKRRNPDMSPRVLVPLRSCLRDNKSSKNINDGHEVYDHIFGVIETTPRWLSLFAQTATDGTVKYFESNSFRAARCRKQKTIDRFCDFYEPLYRSRKVSLMMLTFSRINYARLTLPTLLECVKVRYSGLKVPIRGYLWCLELAPNSGMDGGFHIHYHLIVAIDRVKWEKIPDALKFHDLWGQRTGVEFIRKSIRGYLAKYMAKSQAHLLNFREYAISRELT